MKVLDLRCAHDHFFEGWFASNDEFAQQGERGLIECPICADTAITRLPSAPRLNMSRPRDDGSPALNGRHESDRDGGGREQDDRNDGARDEPNAVGPSTRQTAEARAQGQWLRAAREAIQRTEDVGHRFPEEARRMHYGEVEGRSIRGCASLKEAEALREEGITIVAIPAPLALKDSLQ